MGQFVLIWYYILMIFKQLFDVKSSTYTYLISSGKGREALIIDPVLENINEYIVRRVYMKQSKCKTLAFDIWQ